ncbi:MAG: 50S ribosomal protein L25 [Candidatus Korobacteraceae bacterium]|jgi:large subunit ribosomal protein L25
MSTAANLVEAKPREASDKNAARRLRRTGSIPAVLYGAGGQPRAIAVDPKQIIKILHSESGHNTIIDVSLDGEQAKAMIVDWQNEPIKGHLLHVDLKRIAMDKVLQISVPILLKGESIGVKTEGGVLDFVLREIEIECLPGDIPRHIECDISALVFGQPIRVSDLPHPEKIKFLTDPTFLVAHVVAIKEEVAPTVEAAAEEAAAGPTEPEVIKKGKGEEGTEKEAPEGKKEAKEGKKESKESKK